MGQPATQLVYIGIDCNFMNKELDEDSTFTQEIEDNWKICSNCYRRLIEYTIEPHNTLPNAVTERTEYSDSIYFGYFDDYQESGRPSKKKTYCECGFVDDGKMRPLDSSQMSNVAVRVHERLEEQDIEYDQGVFFDVVKEKKSDPKLQFNEEKILEEATERAIKAYNG